MNYHWFFKTSHLFDKYYRERPGFVNGTKAFHNLCQNNISGGARILEIGPGPSNKTSDFLASLGSLVGVDVSNESSNNRALQSWHSFDGTVLPFADNTFDYCVSNWVIEHVEDPLEHFSEVQRVLRPGGTYFFRTPNALHYVGLISRYSPHWFHRVVANRVRGLAADAHEPWPTFYRCNTLKRAQTLPVKAGFQRASITMLETEPSYGTASPVLFYPMVLWERCLNATELLSWQRFTILGALTTPSLIDS